MNCAALEHNNKPVLLTMFCFSCSSAM